MPFLLYRSFNQQFLKLYKDNPLWHDLEQEFSFYETDFQVINRNHTSRYNYQDIVAILDKPESFYIMVGRSMGLILDKADCQPELIDFLLKLKENRSLWYSSTSVFYLLNFQKIGLLEASYVIILFMRVVAGKYGGRPLKTLDGKTTRPTTDKVKGAIFNMIGPYFDGGRVLDLYAGSGSLAIEAISRGMETAVLVEKDRRAQAIISENIQMTKESERFDLLKMESGRALDTLTGAFDLVLLDPPYAKEQIVADLEKLEKRQLLSQDVLVVCETDKEVELPEEIAGLGIWKQKIYGISKVTVYVR